MSRGKSQFKPSDVPEIKNGYYWLVKDQIGFGTTSFRIPEGNKKSTHDLVQATVASQYTQLFENGQAQARMRKSTDPNPTTLQTTAAVTAGWTGPTYMGGWFRLPDASGDITSFVTLFVHSAAARRIRLQGLNESPDHFLTSASSDGAVFTGINRFNNSDMLAGFDWRWIEMMFDPLNSLGGSATTDRLKVFANLTQVTIAAAGSAVGTVIADSSAIIAVGNAGTGGANTDTVDWSTCYYGNGIPSIKNRKRLANHYNPLNIKFQIAA